MADFGDKFIVILLIVIMPVSVIMAARMKAKYDSTEGEVAISENMEKIDLALAEIESKVADSQIGKANPITIESVEFATKSGQLMIKGKAPTPDMNVMVATIVTEKTSAKEASSTAKKIENVLGEEVDLVAVRADINGVFKFIREVNVKKTELVEIKFEQGDSSETVVWDVVKKKWVN